MGWKRYQATDRDPRITRAVVSCLDIVAEEIPELLKLSDNTMGMLECEIEAALDVAIKRLAKQQEAVHGTA